MPPPSRYRLLRATRLGKCRMSGSRLHFPPPKDGNSPRKQIACLPSRDDGSLANRARTWHDGLGEGANRVVDTMLMNTKNQPIEVSTGQEIVPAKRVSRARFALAFGVAAISDFLSMWTEFAPPIQWVIDLGTAGLLFLILGRRWALLPGLIVEAIPGMGVFPVWVLVVISVIVYDEIKAHKRT